MDIQKTIKSKRCVSLLTRFNIFKMKKVIIIELESEAENQAIENFFENHIRDNFREGFRVIVRDK